MIKIGITGSLASGKTTASKILSFRRGPLFSADEAVRQLYKNEQFKSLVSRRFKIKNNSQIKKSLKKLIIKIGGLNCFKIIVVIFNIIQFHIQYGVQSENHDKLKEHI